MADGKIVIELQGKDQATAMLVKNLQQLGQGAKAAEKDIGGAFTGMTGQVMAFARAHAAALAGIAAGYVSFKGLETSVNKFVEMNSAAKKLSTVMGSSIQDAAILGDTFGKMGIDTDTATSALFKMVRQLRTNEDEFKRNNIATRDAEGNLLSLNQIMFNSVERLKQLEAGTEANMLATVIFGRSVKDMPGFLKMTQEALDETRARFERLGLTLDDVSASRARAYKEGLHDVGLVFDALKYKVGDEVIPILIEFGKIGAEVGPPLIRGFGEGLRVVHEFLGGATVAVSDIRNAFAGAWDSISKGATAVKQRLMETCGTDVVGSFAAGLAAMGTSLDDWREKAIRDANEVRFAVMSAMAGKTVEGGESDDPLLRALTGKTQEKKKEARDKYSPPPKGGKAGKEMAFTEVTPFQQWEWKMEDLEDLSKDIDKFLDINVPALERLVKAEQSYASEMASLSPLLADQIRYKEEALLLEDRAARLALDRERNEDKIGEAVYAQELHFRDLLTQAKKLSLEREKWARGGGFGAGLQLYREDLDKRPSMFSGVWWKESMSGAENWIGSTFANTAVDIFQQRKTDFRAMGQQMLAGFFGEMSKRSWQRLLGLDFNIGAENRINENGIAQWGDVADGMRGATDLLSSSAMSGIAAGASLGVGAMALITGSQELMVAATVIQIAAGLLEIAAMMDILPFHGGGIVTAHRGLAPNEILVKALRDEWILQPSATRSLADMGVSFDMLNAGRVPAVPVPVASGREPSRTKAIEHHYHNTVQVIATDSEDVKRWAKKHGNTLFDAQRHPVRNHRQLSNFKNINGGQ